MLTKNTSFIYHYIKLNQNIAFTVYILIKIHIYIHQYRQYSIWIIAYKSYQDNEVLLNSIWQEIVIIVNKATTSLDRKHYLCFTWGKQSFPFFQIEAVMSAYDFHMQSGEKYCSFLKPMYIVHENSLRLLWCIHMIKIRKNIWCHWYITQYLYKFRRGETIIKKQGWELNIKRRAYSLLSLFLCITLIHSFEV